MRQLIRRVIKSIAILLFALSGLQAVGAAIVFLGGASVVIVSKMPDTLWAVVGAFVLPILLGILLWRIANRIPPDTR